MSATTLQPARPSRRLHWLRPTPDRLVVGLLVLEAVLWLSERFRWSPLGQHKGWAVLAAVAAIGLFLLAMLGWFAMALAFRRRFQYSIRSLLVLMLAVALVSGWLATEMKNARRQRRIVESIEKVGGYVAYDYDWDPNTPSSPTWLPKCLGDDLLASVTSVNLSCAAAADETLQDVQALAGLHWLSLSHTQVGDAQIGLLAALTQLEYLDVTGTQLTDDGVKRLREALPGCTIRQWKWVADFGENGWIAIAHVGNLLDAEGIGNEFVGAPVYGLFVPKWHTEAATRLLREDAKKRGYWIKFGDNDVIPAAKPIPGAVRGWPQ